jgi:hypothetical protein
MPAWSGLRSAAAEPGKKIGKKKGGDEDASTGNSWCGCACCRDPYGALRRKQDGPAERLTARGSPRRESPRLDLHQPAPYFRSSKVDYFLHQYPTFAAQPDPVTLEPKVAEMSEK